MPLKYNCCCTVLALLIIPTLFKLHTIMVSYCPDVIAGICLFRVHTHLKVGNHFLVEHSRCIMLTLLPRIRIPKPCRPPESRLVRASRENGMDMRQSSHLVLFRTSTTRPRA
ncbi:hypothetical protein BDU57DRAFT_64736 [Ampelomyces quisqualis]|uniref:Secreted protein n=1 Tax=Ampelomyces quisqualis TaxID=50730 RepID=A0A6A5R515_AMPQU|nr:hypothetical protein BDU57DRAFT_64736 [Ampelomyces quisqualis]